MVLCPYIDIVNYCNGNLVYMYNYVMTYGVSYQGPRYPRRGHTYHNGVGAVSHITFIRGPDYGVFTQQRFQDFRQVNFAI